MSVTPPAPPPAPPTPRPLDDPVANPAVLLDVHKLRTRLERAHPQQFGVSERALDAIGEYLRFIELKIRRKDFDAKLLSPSPLIDLVWHQHLLDTRDYQAFCQHACGTMVDHDPDGGNEGAARAERYSRTYREYELAFSMRPKAAFWPAPDFAAVAAPDFAAVAPGAQKRERESSDDETEAPAKEKAPQRISLNIDFLPNSTKPLQLVALSTTTVKRVQDAVRGSMGWAWDKRCLLKFDNAVLIPDKTLADYGITDGSTLDYLCEQIGC